MLPELGLESKDLTGLCQGAGLAIIVTAHDGVDHDRLAMLADQVLDLRGVTKPAPNVVRL